MLSLTGAWISFPAFFGVLSGQKPPQRAAPAAPLAATEQRVDDIVQSMGRHVVAITWPTEKAPVWKVTLEGGEAEIADLNGIVTTRPKPPETLARTMRRLHDGSGMGLAWQVAIFLGGIIPAVLAVTGVTMWIGTRRWRGRPVRQVAPAE